MVPHGKQSGLKSVDLRGFIRVDPKRNDFFKRIIEQRKAHESNKSLKHSLKIIANSGAYGLFVQLDEHIDRTLASLDVYSGEHYHNQSAREIETPGPWYFPPLASLITSGGRLLLAMAEKCVSEAGGTWLFCDTDSIAVVASAKGGKVRGASPEEHDDLAMQDGLIDEREFASVPVLSHDTVRKISERFTSLNPYNFDGTILKIEDVNHENNDPSKPLRTVQGEAIS
jgi:DNA polymerase elongation subunit (family B)